MIALPQLSDSKLGLEKVHATSTKEGVGVNESFAGGGGGGGKPRKKDKKKGNAHAMFPSKLNRLVNKETQAFKEGTSTVQGCCQCRT